MSRTRENLIGFQTIVMREVTRVMRIWVQTIVPPAITMTLYFIIFGSLIGRRIGEMGGYDYMAYIAPGLIMMSIAQNAFALRFTTADGERLLVVNLGADSELHQAPHPQLAPPPGRLWRTLITTENPRYGGRGGPEPEHEDGRWHLVARSAVLLEPHAGETTT